MCTHDYAKAFRPASSAGVCWASFRHCDAFCKSATQESRIRFPRGDRIIRRLNLAFSVHLALTSIPFAFINYVRSFGVWTLALNFIHPLALLVSVALFPFCLFLFFFFFFVQRRALAEKCLTFVTTSANFSRSPFRCVGFASPPLLLRLLTPGAGFRVAYQFFN